MKRRLCGHFGNQMPKSSLIVFAKSDVIDLAAHDAHQVVMMPGKPLGHFVSGVRSGAVVTRHNTGLLENGQRSVQRREWNRVVEVAMQFSGGTRSLGCHQGVDHRTPARRVPDAVLAQPRLHLPINSCGCHHGPLLIMILNIIVMILIPGCKREPTCEHEPHTSD